jgi:hypothetical protein
MNKNSQVESAAKDASTFTRFINLTGDISKVLYLATHREEDDDAPRPIVIRKRKVSTKLRHVAA